LHVDADAVLAASVAFQGLKAVAGQCSQILKACCCVYYLKAFPALPVEALKLPDKVAVRKSLGPFIAKAQNHTFRIVDFYDLRQA
jgi:hypothetical protein